MKLKDEMELTWRGAENHVLRERTASAKGLRQKRIWQILGIGSRSTEDSGKRGVQRGSRSPTLQGHVSHGFYPKLNGKAQKAFKQDDMVQFTLSKITLAARWRFERIEGESRKLLEGECLSRFEQRGVRGDAKTQMDAKLFYHNRNANCCSAFHH